MAEADFKNGLGGFGEGGTRLSPPEDDDVDVGDADPAAIMAFSSSILDHSHQGATISPKTVARSDFGQIVKAPMTP